MANNIFQQYLQPVRSIGERMAEFDAQDVRREQLTGLRHQNALQSLAMQRDAEARATAQQDNTLLQQLAGQSGGDQNALIRALRGSGRMALMGQADVIEKALLDRQAKEAQTKQSLAAASKSEVDADKERLAMARSKADTILQAVSAARDPGSYSQAIQWLGAQGIDTSSIPAQYDPKFVQTAGQQAMTVKDRADQEWKAKGYDLDVQRVAESVRHNKASEGLQVRGQNLADARAREKNANDVAAAGKVEWKQDTNGNWIALPKEVSGTGPVTPISTTAPGKRETQAKQALNIIDQAGSLIDKGTASYLGAGVDQAARVVGASTPGADAAAQLKALEGALMMAQPRMEGPQSDKDVALYRQMAAQIGDSTVPRSQKRAALTEIRRLHEQYAGGQAAPQATRGAPSGMPSVADIDAELQRRAGKK